MSGHGGHGGHDEHESHLKAATGALVGVLTLALARGLALFLGVYTIVNTVVGVVSEEHKQDLWWIDLSFLPDQAALTFGVACSLVLLAYAAAPELAKWRQWITVGACGALAASAIENMGGFYRAWEAESFQPGFAIPYSIAVAALFGILAWAVLTVHPEHVLFGDHVAMFAGFGLMLVLFPLLVAIFFGTSDYSMEADAAVVFGGRVRDDGSLSPALRDRVGGAIDVYKDGVAETIIMSGNTGTNGVDEAAAMRKFAVKRGVPSSAILLNDDGEDTESAVANTADLFSRYGFKRVLAVSQWYHLPRIKLAYFAQGWDVRTVPVTEQQPSWGAPFFFAREVPGFWQYWVQAVSLWLQGD